MTSRLWSVEFDANDPVRLARFWAAALGWAFEEEQDEGYCSIAGGEGTVRRLGFASVPSEKRSPNWMHFDLGSTSIEHQRATADRLVGLGARRIDIGQGPDAG
ncbi:MAG: VOC family protein, partial [Actinobacteria bacterium]|nr:VOC family protein [Actinomycetota bacterium]